MENLEIHVDILKVRTVVCVISQYLFYLDFLKALVSFGANAVNLCQVYILSCVQVNATVTSASQRLTGVF